MELQENETIFLDFLNSQINRNIEIQEDNLLEEYSLKFDTHKYIENNKKIFQDIYSLKYLSPYISDNQVNEIIVHDFETIQIEKNGTLSTIFLKNLKAPAYLLSLEILALKNKVTWNYSSPFASFNTKIEENNFRCSLIHNSCGTMRKSKLFLRRIKTFPYSISDFKIPTDIELEIKRYIEEKKNILIAGAAGSGKSSFLATLLNQIPENQHIIVLEDTHEIPISKKNFTFFLGNENLPHKSLIDLCSYSLRLRPDRMVLGEIRSSEIIPFVLAMNTGHRGMMSSIHADSGQDALARMAMLFLIFGEGKSFSFEMALKLISKNVDIVVFLKDKKVLEIIKIIGSERGILNFDYCWKNNLS